MPLVLVDTSVPIDHLLDARLLTLNVKHFPMVPGLVRAYPA